jgi:hypothetical protein
LDCHLLLETVLVILSSFMETLGNPGDPHENGPVTAVLDLIDGRQAVPLFRLRLTTAKKQTKREKFLVEMQAVVP